VPESAQRRLLATFLEAARSGDLVALERLFAADVASVSDGNGAPGIARKVVTGAARVAKFIAAFATHYWQDVEIRAVTVNGQAGVLLSRGATLLGVVTVTASADGIDQVLWMMNPEKLAGV
jgi:RNA polymerase sigma-70 factor (ECF subfamily)